MPQSTLPTQFFGKTWIFLAQAIVCGSIGIPMLLIGPFFLLGILKDARGKPAHGAGISMMLGALGMCAFAALAVFNILSRRKPIIRICREGLEVNVIGSSTLDGVPFMPRILRAVWPIITGEGFKQQILRAPWEHFRHVQVSGPAMAQSLLVTADFFPLTATTKNIGTPKQNAFVFAEVEFQARIDDVATVIFEYAKAAGQCSWLPSWDSQSE